MTKDEARLWFEAQREKLKQERQIKLREYWENLQPFEDHTKIPDLPTGIDPVEWKEFYVKKLIGAGAIPKEALNDGGYYIGDHRNANVARWNAEKSEFEYWRFKWGNRFIDTCNHFEDDDGFALFVPIKEATEDQFERNDI